MYILTNALRNVSRSKGRSILIGIIVILISFSICIGLCIRQAASNAETSALEDLNITAQISPDRGAAMEMGRGEPGEMGEPGEFDKDKMKDAMKEALSLDELKTYAKADSVKNFYYTYTLSMDASGSLEAYSMQKSDGNEGQGGPEGMPGGMSDADFSVIGYSSDDAMTDFTDGTCSISEGKVFEEGTENLDCIISDELAEYNGIEVGDKIRLVNPDNEDDKYSLKVTGIYTNSQSSAMAGGMGPGMGGGMGMVTDPANCIYMSAAAVKKIESSSEKEDLSLTASLSGTYVLGDMDSYEKFSEEVKELGLEDGYAVSSSDINEYEQRLEPLQNLAGYAKYFLILIIAIGVIVLGVLNIFSTRERKYEIGVLTAIGMKKSRVAEMFVAEILMIAIVGTIVGGGIGAATSVPVTNALLSSQIESSQQEMDGRNDAFGRDFQGSEQPPEKPDGEEQSESDENQPPEKPGINTFVSDVSSAVNVKVLLEVLGLCIALAAVSGLASAGTIMRNEPLDILTERD